MEVSNLAVGFMADQPGLAIAGLDQDQTFVSLQSKDWSSSQSSHSLPTLRIKPELTEYYLFGWVAVVTLSMPPPPFM
jgi:hypothetical protein